VTVWATDADVSNATLGSKRSKVKVARLESWQWSLVALSEFVSVYLTAKAQTPLIRFVVDLLYSLLYNKSTINRISVVVSAYTTFHCSQHAAKSDIASNGRALKHFSIAPSKVHSRRHVTLAERERERERERVTSPRSSVN